MKKFINNIDTDYLLGVIFGCIFCTVVMVSCGPSLEEIEQKQKAQIEADSLKDIQTASTSLWKVIDRVELADKNITTYVYSERDTFAVFSYYGKSLNVVKLSK